MLSSVLARSIDDRWRGTLMGTLIVGLFLVGGLAAYKQIDLSIYTDLPQGVRSMMNIPDGADVASLAFGVIYGLMAAMTLAGFGLSMGAASIAGEEGAGTLGLLLASPRSRTQILIAKTAAMVIVLTAGAVVLWVAGVIAPQIVGVTMGSTNTFALVVHMYANALLFGFLAAAIGAWTGSRTVAVGATAGIMVLSYVAVGILPLSSATANVAKAFPWYYFDGSTPFNSGMSGVHLAVQIGSAAVFAVVAFVGVNRRDLRKSAGGGDLLARLQEHPLAVRIVERLGGTSQVSQVWAKAASESQPTLIIVSLVMFSIMGLLMGPMYRAIEDSLGSFAQDLPENLMAFVGGGDMSTPEGWYQVESLGLMAPIAIMLVTVSFGARAVAGEEGQQTMGLLLANPISRRRVLLEKFGAMAIHATIVAIATFAGVVGGSVIAGLGISVANIAAACLMLVLLGIMFGAVSLTIGAATGRTRHATVGAIAVAGSLYMANALLSIAGSAQGWARISPFYWYLGHDPLLNGISWGYAALFIVVTIALLALAVALFDRRDLRRG